MPFTTTASAVTWQRRIQAAMFGKDFTATTLAGRLLDASNNVLVNFSTVSPTANTDGTGSVTAAAVNASSAGTVAKFQLVLGSEAIHEVSSNITVRLSGTAKPSPTVESNKSYSVSVNYTRKSVTPEYEQTNTWRQRKIAAFLGLSVPAITMTSRLQLGGANLLIYSQITTSDASTNQTSVTMPTATASGGGTIVNSPENTQLQFLNGSTIEGQIPGSLLTLTDSQGLTTREIKSAEKYAVSGSGISVSIAA